MTKDFVKKSVDITQKDEEWLEEQPINFSKWVRHKIAEERLEELRDAKKIELYNQLLLIADKGRKLYQEWKEAKEQLQKEHDVEIQDQQTTHCVVEFDGDIYTMHWRPDDPFDGVPEEPPKEVEEFANEFMTEWFDTLDAFEDYVEEETSFEIVQEVPETQDFRGTGFLSEFDAYSNYLPTGLASFTVKFEDRVDVCIEDLEKLFSLNKDQKNAKGDRE